MHLISYRSVNFSLSVASVDHCVTRGAQLEHAEPVSRRADMGEHHAGSHGAAVQHARGLGGPPPPPRGHHRLAAQPEQRVSAGTLAQTWHTQHTRKI
jgi:hypothetical protein